MNQRKLTGILLFAVAGAIAFLDSAPAKQTVRFVQRANAVQEPRVIEIKAKKFAFFPSEIILKKGEPVIFRLSTEDRTHGFVLKPLIDTDIPPGKAMDVAVTPTASGQYLVICDHYCGAGDGNMRIKLTVVE